MRRLWVVLGAGFLFGAAFVSPGLVAKAPQSAAKVNLAEPYRVTVGAAAVQLTTSGQVHGVIIRCVCPGQTVYIGASASVTTATGYPLSDGESLALEVFNANQIWAIASAASQALAVLPYSRF